MLKYYYYYTICSNTTIIIAHCDKTTNIDVSARQRTWRATICQGTGQWGVGPLREYGEFVSADWIKWATALFGDAALTILAIFVVSDMCKVERGYVHTKTCLKACCDLCMYWHECKYMFDYLEMTRIELVG